MSLVGQRAPDFELEGYFDGEFKTYKLSDFKGKWTLLLFYPLDFTFVCPSEILAFDRKVEEFSKKDCQLIGVSVDSHFTHLAWKETAVEKGGIGGIQYPLGVLYFWRNCISAFEQGIS